MSEILHVFQCGDADLFGITRDPAGSNLPDETCPAWRHIKAIDFQSRPLQSGIDADWQERDSALRAGLSVNGFFLTERGAMPLAFRQQLEDQ